MNSTGSNIFGLASILSSPQEIKRFIIPTEKANPPEDEMLDFFNRLYLRGDFSPKTLEEGKFLFLTCVRPWLIKLHWLYKLSYDSSHKIPAKRAAVSYYKHHALILINIREICKELHTRHGRQTGYPDADNLFCLAIADQILLTAQLRLDECRESKQEILETQEPASGCQKKKIAYGPNKKDAIKGHRSHWLEQLRAGESPFRNEDPNFCPHWRKVIDMAIAEADPNTLFTEGGNVFRRKYWKPYLKSESALITEWDRNPSACRQWYSDGSFYAQRGKGKGRVVVAKIT